MTDDRHSFKLLYLDEPTLLEQLEEGKGHIVNRNYGIMQGRK
jgi:hypothetical protein